MSELKKRLEKLAPLERKAKAVVIFNQGNNPNFFYLTNSNVSGIFYYDFHKPRIFTSEMEFTRAKKSWIGDVQTVKDKNEIFTKVKGKAGIDAKNISAWTYRKIRAKKVDISDFFENIRAIKTRYEVGCLKRSCKIATKVYAKAEKEITKSMTEMGLKGLIEFLMHKEGVTPSFSTIVASGSGVKYPHYESANKKITEPLLIDMGVKYNGYCSDITRTTGSDFGDQIKKVFDEVVPRIKPGIKAAQLDNKARNALGKYSKFFTHGLGHGLGTEIHEKPSLSLKSKDVMKEGMVFTIEPGLYLKGGIRHEEDFLLTESGAVKLT